MRVQNMYLAAALLISTTASPALAQSNNTGLRVMHNIGDAVTSNQRLQIVGLWVGNMSYKIGQDSSGNLYTIAPDGTRKAMARGTRISDVSVPLNSPIIEGLLNGRPVPKAEDSKDKPKFVVGQRGLLQPKVIATRTMVVNGRPVIVGGAIISELPPAEMPQATQPAQKAQMPRPQQIVGQTTKVQEASYARVMPKAAKRTVAKQPQKAKRKRSKRGKRA